MKCKYWGSENVIKYGKVKESSATSVKIVNTSLFIMELLLK